MPSPPLKLINQQQQQEQLQDYHFLVSYGGSQKPCLSGQMVAVPSWSWAADNLGRDFDRDLIRGFDTCCGPPTVTVTTFESLKGVRTGTVGAI